MKHEEFSKILLFWYDEFARELPWRETADPYKIWLSEVILQQTRVNQGMPYYHKIVARFPTLEALANADIDEVLRYWQGLGYYSRARNMHKCAKTVMDRYDGSFPKTRDELLTLPGIGPYTSAAIASFAFGERTPAVDGNVIRVIARIFGIKDDVGKPGTLRTIDSTAKKLISRKEPGKFNQAIMEFGATHCTPRSPDCHSCPFLGKCLAQKHSLQSDIPYKPRKIKKRDRYFQYLLITHQGKILMEKRTGRDIWNGLYHFVLVESDSDKDFDHLQLPAVLSQNKDQWILEEESETISHMLTHQKIYARFFHIEVMDNKILSPDFWEGYRLFSADEIENLAKPILIDKYLGGKII